jgi:hypothetical protein
MRGLFVLIILFFSCSVMGQQDLLIKKEQDYYYQNTRYKCKELGPIYRQNKESYELYISGRKFKKIGQISAYTGAGLIMAGVAVAPGVSLQNKNTGLLIVGVGLFFEMLAITPLLIGRRNLIKARQTFNFKMLERHGFKSDTSLSLAPTHNGFGLLLSF